MMIWFWISIALMTAIAVVIVLLPLVVRQKLQITNREQLNINLYRQQISDLKEQLSQQQISEALYVRREQELAKTLLEEGKVQSAVISQMRPAIWVKIALIIALPIIAILLYLHFGASHSLQRYWVLKRQASAVKAELSKIKSPKQVIDRLIAHLKAYPNSAKGWYLLGRLYLGERRYANAVSVLSKAYYLQPKKTEYAIAYAQALFFNQKQHLSKKAKQLLNQVLVKNRNNIPALNLLAIDAYRAHRYKSAVHYWEKMLPLFAPNSKESKMLLMMMAKAQKKLE